jgi:hypothetical protein
MVGLLDALSPQAMGGSEACRAAGSAWRRSRERVMDSCPYCGMIHQAICPRIKAIEYYPDGISVKRIEFTDQGHVTHDPPKTGVILDWLSRDWVSRVGN